MDEVELATRLTQIEAKLDELVRVNKKRGEDHETRLRSLERWKYALPASFFGTLVAALVAIFGGG